MCASRLLAAPGLVGRKTVAALERAGHDVVALARTTGIDLTTGEGLDAALEGVATVVDVTNAPNGGATRARAFFEAETRQLLAA